MNIRNAFLHHIEQSLDTIDSVDLTQHYDDIEPIVQSILDEILSGKNKRACLIPSDSTFLSGIIEGIENESIEIQRSAATMSAERLLRKEKDAQEQYGSITQIPKGSLFHLLVEQDDKMYFIITKTDHDKFLDEKELLTRRGIPLNKKTYKSFYCNIVDGQLINGFIYDSSGRSARYWWEGYLDVQLCNSDAKNTELVLNYLINNVISSIKVKSPDDYRVLRDNTIYYFRSHQEFNLSAYLNNVWEHYSPLLEDLSLERSKEKVRNMSENKKFDTSFSIIPASINRRVKRSIQLAPKLKLQLDDMNFEEEKDVIFAYANEHGKWIRIKTDVGYDYFKRNENC